MRYLTGGIESRKQRVGYALVLPSLILVCFISLFPFFVTLGYSFHTIRLNDPALGRPFVGFQNFAYLLGNGRFLNSLGRTLFFTFTFCIVELALGLCIALVLNIETRWKWLVRVAVLIPWAMANVVTALMWKWMYSPRVGVINNILVSLGVFSEPVDLLGASSGVVLYVSILVVDIWRNSPFVAIVILAGLQDIPLEIYESSKMDGAGRFGRFSYITLPWLRHTILVALLFRSIDWIRAFDLLYVMTNGGPGTSTEILSIYGYFQLFKSLNFGRGSAISIFITLLTTGLCVAYFGVMKHED